MADINNDYKSEGHLEVFRVEKDFGFYTQIFLGVAAYEDALSYKAIGLHTRLITWPEGKAITREALIKSAKGGKDAVASGLDELERAGYLTRTKYRMASGQWATEWHVYAVSQTRGLPAKMVEALKKRGITLTIDQQTALAQHSDDATKEPGQPGYTQLTIDSLPVKQVPEKAEDICQTVVDMYHKHCPDLPKVRKLTNERKKKIKARIKDFGLDGLKEIFQKAEESDFLRTGSGTWKGADLDFLLSPAKATRVLEGSYDNKENEGVDHHDRNGHYSSGVCFR